MGVGSGDTRIGRDGIVGDIPVARLRNISQLYDLLEEYAAHVNRSLLTESSQRDYIMFAELFVRWIDNDFEPGATLRNHQMQESSGILK